MRREDKGSWCFTLDVDSWGPKAQSTRACSSGEHLEPCWDLLTPPPERRVICMAPPQSCHWLRRREAGPEWLRRRGGGGGAGAECWRCCHCCCFCCCCCGTGSGPSLAWRARGVGRPRARWQQQEHTENHVQEEDPKEQGGECACCLDAAHRRQSAPSGRSQDCASWPGGATQRAPTVRPALTWWHWRLLRRCFQGELGTSPPWECSRCRWILDYREGLGEECRAVRPIAAEMARASQAAP